MGPLIPYDILEFQEIVLQAHKGKNALFIRI